MDTLPHKGTPVAAVVDTVNSLAVHAFLFTGPLSIPVEAIHKRKALKKETFNGKEGSGSCRSPP